MADINNMLADLAARGEKIRKDLEEVSRAYGRLESEMRHRYRDELSYNRGSSEGLEDFFMLNATIRRNSMAVRNAAVLMKKVKDLSGYDISEEEILDKIFDKKRKKRK